MNKLEGELGRACATISSYSTRNSTVSICSGTRISVTGLRLDVELLTAPRTLKTMKVKVFSATNPCILPRLKRSANLECTAVLNQTRRFGCFSEQHLGGK